MIRRKSNGLLFVGFMAFFVVTCWWLDSAPTASAQLGSGDTCRAAMVIDRSGSVGERNLQTIRGNILQLFQPGGLYRSDIELGFWSFSSTASISNPTSNYDAPYHDFVSSRNGDLTSNFRTSLNGISSAGATNYEQGFGYNNNILNTFDNMDEIIKKADIIVFMTDGRPNVPGAGDNNLQAREAGKRAVNRLKAGGPAIGEPKYIVGGIVGSTQIQASLNYVLHNGDASNSSDTFFINQDYSGLSERLKEVIGTKCDELFPPDPDEEYNLAPQVTLVSDPIVSDTRNALFSYSVNSTGTATSTEDTEWSIRRLIVDRSQPVADLYFGNDAYRDDYSCDALLELVDNNASCTDTPVVSGTRNFALGSNLLDADALAATSITIDDEWQVGTKLCYVLSLDRPTHLNNPQDRFSSAKCITIGKKPFVQIHGGDLRVGRQFANGGTEGNEDDVNQDPSSVITSVTSKTSGLTYGSWVEYGVFSAGPVLGLGSMSGLSGGSPSADQSQWSTLTFANTDNEYGHYSQGNIGEGTIPDAAGAILAGRAVDHDLAGATAVDFNGDDARGLYKKETGNLTINESTIEKGSIERNRTIIVHVPNGQVTIAGNVSYVDGPYSRIEEIPQLIIIAQSIVINADVVNVSAWLIANDTNDGSVSTCEIEQGLTSEVCNQLLRINGPIMANQLNLRRTGGAGRDGASGDPAEIINLPADTYLWSHSAGRSDFRVRTTHTIELPPYF